MNLLNLLDVSPCITHLYDYINYIYLCPLRYVRRRAAMNSMRQVRQTATKQRENRRKANLWQEAFKKTTQAARRKKTNTCKNQKKRQAAIQSLQIQTQDRQDSQSVTNQRRIWRQNDSDRMKTATPIWQGGFKCPLTKKPQTIQETPNEEKEDDSIEAHLRQHAREIANLKGQIAENDYKTETVQRQTAYLLRKNSKREEEEEEEEAGMLATIFGWPKEATLEDRKFNARWLIDQSGVKDEKKRTAVWNLAPGCAR